MEASQGQMLEIGPNGKVRWKYRNLVAPGVRAQIFDAQRLDPALMTAERIKALSAACKPARA